MGEWMDDRAGLRIAYSNKKLLYSYNQTSTHRVPIKMDIKLQISKKLVFGFWRSSEFGHTLYLNNSYESVLCVIPRKTTPKKSRNENLIILEMSDTVYYHRRTLIRK